MRRLLALLPLLLAAPALAQPRPEAVTPQRDVTVTYRTIGGQTVRMAWNAAERMTRIDAQGAPGAMILDQIRQRAFVVMERERAVMQLPLNGGSTRLPRSPEALLAGGQLTRLGADSVAGLACTLWQREAEGRKATACLTNDGVLLRMQVTGTPPEGMEATEVRYGPADPALFVPPAAYRVMEPPTIGARRPG
jgi:YD repeat-containing protein